VTLRTRLTFVAAGVVAVVVALACATTYFVMRHELYSQVDTQLDQHAHERTTSYSDLSPYFGDSVAVIEPDGTADNPHNIPVDKKIGAVADHKTKGFFRNVGVVDQNGVSPMKNRTAGDSEENVRATANRTCAKARAERNG
jgi:hypothetical protein